jgi:hypothetical protein
MVRHTWLVGVFSLAAGVANATPVHFDVDGNASSVTTSGVSLCLGCSVNVALDSLLDTQAFDLNAGQSSTFNLFRITASGFLGAIAGTVQANLAFSLPTPSTSTGTAAAAAVFAFGFGTGGLTFGVLGQPHDTLFGNGGRFGVSFSSVQDTCHGRWTGCTLADTVTATVTLFSESVTGAPPTASVPEPMAVTLFGLGLIGVGLVRRRWQLA